MRRLTLLAVACLLTLPVFAAAQAPPAPAQKAKYIPPVRGVATIDVFTVSSKRMPKEMVTVIKVKNTSNGSINLLKANEYWYDKDRKMVTADQYAHKKAPIQPGEIVEITLRSPVQPGTTPLQNQIMFEHANGKVMATKVKALK
jgi:hypothetical protein